MAISTKTLKILINTDVEKGIEDLHRVSQSARALGITVTGFSSILQKNSQGLDYWSNRLTLAGQDTHKLIASTQELQKVLANSTTPPTDVNVGSNSFTELLALQKKYDLEQAKILEEKRTRLKNHGKALIKIEDETEQQRQLSAKKGADSLELLELRATQRIKDIKRNLETELAIIRENAVNSEDKRAMQAAEKRIAKAIALATREIKAEEKVVNDSRKERKTLDDKYNRLDTYVKKSLSLENAAALKRAVIARHGADSIELIELESAQRIKAIKEKLSSDLAEVTQRQRSGTINLNTKRGEVLSLVSAARNNILSEENTLNTAKTNYQENESRKAALLKQSKEENSFLLNDLTKKLEIEQSAKVLGHKHLKTITLAFVQDEKLIKRKLKSDLAQIDEEIKNGSIKTAEDAANRRVLLEQKAASDIKAARLTLDKAMPIVDEVNELHTGLGNLVKHIVKVYAIWGSVDFLISKSSEAIRSIIPTGIALDSVKATFEATIGSSAGVNSTLSALNKEAARTGLVIKDLRTNFSLLYASTSLSNVSLDDSWRIFQNLNTIGTALHKTTDEMNHIFLATTQIFNKNKVQSEELVKQLGNLLPGAFASFAKSINISTEELVKRMKAGTVLARDTMVDFTEFLAVRFSSSFALASKMLNADIGRMQNAFILLGETVYSSVNTPLGQLVRSITEGTLAFNTFVQSSEKVNTALSVTKVAAISLATAGVVVLTAKLAKLAAEWKIVNSQGKTFITAMTVGKFATIGATIAAATVGITEIGKAQDKSLRNTLDLLKEMRLEKEKVAANSPQATLNEKISFDASQDKNVLALEKEIATLAELRKKYSEYSVDVTENTINRIGETLGRNRFSEDTIKLLLREREVIEDIANTSFPKLNNQFKLSQPLLEKGDKNQWTIALESLNLYLRKQKEIELERAKAELTSKKQVDDVQTLIEETENLKRAQEQTYKDKATIAQNQARIIDFQIENIKNATLEGDFNNVDAIAVLKDKYASILDLLDQKAQKAEEAYEWEKKAAAETHTNINAKKELEKAEGRRLAILEKADRAKKGGRLSHNKEVDDGDKVDYDSLAKRILSLKEAVRTEQDKEASEAAKHLQESQKEILDARAALETQYHEERSKISEAYANKEIKQIEDKIEKINQAYQTGLTPIKETFLSLEAEINKIYEQKRQTLEEQKQTSNDPAYISKLNVELESLKVEQAKENTKLNGRLLSEIESYKRNIAEILQLRNELTGERGLGAEEEFDLTHYEKLKQILAENNGQALENYQIARANFRLQKDITDLAKERQLQDDRYNQSLTKINIYKENNIITEWQSLHKITDINKLRIAQLQQQIQKEKEAIALAEQNSPGGVINDEAKRNLLRLEDELENLKLTADSVSSYVEAKFSDAFKTLFSDLSKIITLSQDTSGYDRQLQYLESQRSEIEQNLSMEQHRRDVIGKINGQRVGDNREAYLVKQIQQTDEQIEKLNRNANKIGTTFSLNLEAATQAFSNFTISVIQHIADIAAQEAASGILQNVLKPLVGGLFGGETTPSSGFNLKNLSTSISSAFDSSKPFAKGGAFTNTILDTPTVFTFAKGQNFGIGGEAGPEAVMPLRRDKQGNLGVISNGNSSEGGIYFGDIIVTVEKGESDGDKLGSEIATAIMQKIASQEAKKEITRAMRPANQLNRKTIG